MGAKLSNSLVYWTVTVLT